MFLQGRDVLLHGLGVGVHWDVALAGDLQRASELCHLIHGGLAEHIQHIYQKINKHITEDEISRLYEYERERDEGLLYVMYDAWRVSHIYIYVWGRC